MVGVQTVGSKTGRGVRENQGCVDISQPSPILSFCSSGGGAVGTGKRGGGAACSGETTHMDGGGPSNAVGCQRSGLRRSCGQQRGTEGVGSGWDTEGLGGEGLLLERLNPGNNTGVSAEWEGRRRGLHRRDHGPEGKRARSRSRPCHWGVGGARRGSQGLWEREKQWRRGRKVGSRGLVQRTVVSG